MKTLYSWLIANIGVVTTTCLIIIWVILVYTGVIIDPDGNSKVDLYFYIPFLICFAGDLAEVTPTKNFLGDLFMLVFLAGFIWFVYCFVGEQDHPWLCNIVWGIAPSIVFAVFVANFTYNNFDQVVSLRMLYRMSEVDLFESRIMYSFNRFVSALYSGIFVTLFIIMVCNFNRIMNNIIIEEGRNPSIEQLVE